MKSNTLKMLIILFPLCGFGRLVNAQTILENYVQEGLKNNLALKQENLEIEKAVENINQARALFYPRVTFAPTYSLAAGGRKLEFPIGDLLNPVYSTLNQLTKTNSFPQVENVSQQLAPNNFHDTKLTIQYALYDPQIKYNYLIQKSLINVEDAKKKVIESEVRHNIETAYYQYLQSLEAEKIFKSSRVVLQELSKLNQKLVANNVLTKDVIYASEYEIAKLDQQAVGMAKNRQTAQAYFNFLLNRELTTNIVVDTMAVKNPIIPQTLNALSGSNRPELLQLSRSIEVSKQLVEMNEVVAKKPSIFVGGNTGFQGYGYTFNKQGYAILQLGLNWDLFKGYEKKSKIQQAKIQTDILKSKLQEVENQIEMQIAQAYFDLDAAQKNLALPNAGIIKAEQYFKVIDSQYKNGQKLLIEFLKAENDFTTAQLQQSLARYDVLVKQSVLDKVMAK